MVVPVAPKVSKVDVLIIGAGPAGVMAANALASAGVSVRIVDKKSVVSCSNVLHLLTIT